MDPTGTRPILLNNPNGWTNMTRFTTLMASKLARLERKTVTSSTVALHRTLLKIEQQRLREAFTCLQSNACMRKYMTMMAKAEASLGKLSTLVDAFDMDVDNLVEEIIEGEMQRVQAG
mmetsp:Transcript_40772/g.93862  ORF Transcript_40772/g.93862 Transcript_40772/m.93862 type:complete len:118 (+) Transcript_40772:122-475(+)